MKFKYQLFTMFFLILMSCSAQKNTEGFEKIVFNTSECFGTCPIYHLQIDSNKKVQLYAEIVYKKREIDPSQIGYFTGTLTEEIFTKLKTELQKVENENATEEITRYAEAPKYTMIIYTNGKRKFIQHINPTENTRELITLLNKICETNGFNKTSEKFQIEYENASR